MRIKKSIERDCMEQRTEEWFAARLGKVTASRVADVLAKIKSGESASRKNYKMELVVQRLTGKAGESFTNAAMEWGTEQEPFARMAYEAHTGTFVKEEGFVDHPTIEGFGCSPDGIVGEGLIEIKCPNTANHIETILETYSSQVAIDELKMAASIKAWCDIYKPRLVCYDKYATQTIADRLGNAGVMVEDVSGFAEGTRSLFDDTGNIEHVREKVNWYG